MSTIRRAYMEISNGIRGLRLHREQTKSLETQAVPSTSNKDNVTKSNGSLANAVLGRQVRGHRVSARLKAMLQAHAKNAAKSVQELWINEAFLLKFFWYFSIEERVSIACVCKRWRDILYQNIFWMDIMPVLNCKKWHRDGADRARFYRSLESRGFDSICFVAAADADVADFVNNYQGCRKTIRSVSVRCSNVTDAGLDMMFKKMACIYRLELSGCNDITETGLWSILNPKIVSLSVSDCINVADDTLGAISQLLPSLCELNLQAYHVTDTALSFFSAKQSYTVGVLRLRSCWEITNHGIVNIVHSLPNLTILSLSGCSKISDDGVELISENLKKLRILDLSWCPKLSDASLEYIACDLGQLEELVLDRCNHITDIGVGYLSTMTSLLKLYLRWCTQIRDFGLQHVYSMKHLRVLSVAGCCLLSSHGLSGLVSLRYLEELELTNCPGATPDVCQYLKENNPRCLVLE
ncbi:F-box/LRR-repeat protein 16-like [Liolophura sinensis]|uniref:F-box/LRR-repeat protein 16-like n=1 Tax=Liolophura sinensis TaxID=3198878 RepID=UPI003159372C